MSSKEKNTLIHEWGSELEEINSQTKNSCKKFYYKYSSIKFYTSMWVIDKKSGMREQVDVGDNVMISGFSQHPGYYIAKIIAFFDLNEKDLDSNRRCSVEWFYLPDEIPKSKLQLSIQRKNEVIVDLRHSYDVIDANSVLGVCHVTKLAPNQNFPDYDPDFLGIFFFNKGFDGKKIIQINMNEDDSPLPKKRHQPAPSSRSSPKKKVAPPPKRQAKKPRKTAPKAAAAAPKLPEPEDAMPKSKIVSGRDVFKFDAQQAVNQIFEIQVDGEISSGSSDGDDPDEDEQKFMLRPAVVQLERLPSSSFSIKQSSTTTTNNNNNDKPPITITITRDCEVTVPPPARIGRDVSKRRVTSSKKKEQQYDVITETSSKKSHKKNRKSDVSVKMRKSPPPRRVAAESKVESGISTRPRRSNAGRGLYRDYDDFQVTDERAPKKGKGKAAVTSSKVQKKVVHDDVSSDEGSVSDYQENGDDSDDDDDEDESFIVEAKTPRKNRTVASKVPKKIAQKRAQMPNRKFPLNSDKSLLDVARERLHVSSIPGYLPCREDKFENIFMFIHSHLKSGTGGCMFIGGVPGTGKTATVNEVVKTLNEMRDDDELSDFNLIQVNGMKMTHPHQTYVEILKQLNGTKTSPSNASDMLTAYFQQRNKKSTLLIVDELDLLWTKKQDVLYHLFDWPSNGMAKLTVIAIANTMDLPERLMNHRVYSRMGMTRAKFNPYNFQQLQEIVNSRVGELEIFDHGSIELASRKVAAVSGDARRCLDICRRSLDFIGEGEKVKISEIQKSVKEMFSSPVISFMRNCSEHEKLILRAVASQFHQSGLEEALISQILHHHTALCSTYNLPPISLSIVTQIIRKLSASKIITVEESGRNDFYARIRLNTSVDDVLFAINSD